MTLVLVGTDEFQDTRSSNINGSSTRSNSSRSTDRSASNHVTTRNNIRRSNESTSAEVSIPRAVNGSRVSSPLLIHQVDILRIRTRENSISRVGDAGHSTHTLSLQLLGQSLAQSSLQSGLHCATV